MHVPRHGRALGQPALRATAGPSSVRCSKRTFSACSAQRDDVGWCEVEIGWPAARQLSFFTAVGVAAEGGLRCLGFTDCTAVRLRQLVFLVIARYVELDCLFFFFKQKTAYEMPK